LRFFPAAIGAALNVRLYSITGLAWVKSSSLSRTARFTSQMMLLRICPLVDSLPRSPTPNQVIPAKVLCSMVTSGVWMTFSPQAHVHQHQDTDVGMEAPEAIFSLLKPPHRIQSL